MTETLRGISGVDRHRAILHFNKVVWSNAPQEIKGFDEALYVPHFSTKHSNDAIITDNNDLFLKDAANTLLLTDWKEYFGYNLKETMELEFSQYHFLKDYLKKYREIIEQRKEEFENQQKQESKKSIYGKH